MYHTEVTAFQLHGRIEKYMHISQLASSFQKTYLKPKLFISDSRKVLWQGGLIQNYEHGSKNQDTAYCYLD